MQAHHTKDVVRNITTAAQLESELQLAQAQHGVAVLDVYNAEWSYCKALGETFRRLFTDAGDVVYLRFYSVECNAVLASLEHTTATATTAATTATTTTTTPAALRGVAYAADTTAAHWSGILKARQRRSRPYFVFYKEGKLRACLESIDTPRIVTMVHELCKPQKPAAAYVTNASVLQFWHAQLPPDESEIVWDDFAAALQRAGLLRGSRQGGGGGGGMSITLDNGDAAVTRMSGVVAPAASAMARLKAACGCERDVVTAAKVQAWVGDTRTLAEAVAQTLAGASAHATTTTTTATTTTATATSATMDVSSAAAAADAALHTRSSSSSDSERPHDVDDAATADTTAATGDAVTAHNDDDDDNATVAQDTPAHLSAEQQRLWRAVAAVALHYPQCRARTALSRYDVATTAAAVTDDAAAVENNNNDDGRDAQTTSESVGDAAVTAALAALDSADTLAVQLRRVARVDDATLRVLCAAANAKLRADLPPYSKLALLLVSCDATALTQLGITNNSNNNNNNDSADKNDNDSDNTTTTTTTLDYYAAVCDGTLLQQHPAVAFSVLTLCAVSTNENECFYFCPADNGDEAMAMARTWRVGDVVLLAALTPLHSRLPPRRDSGAASRNDDDDTDAHASTTAAHVVRIVGLPAVIELVTTDNNNNNNNSDNNDDDTSSNGGSSNDEAVVLLSGWYAQLTVTAQSPEATELRFVAYAHAAAYDAQADAYIQRSMRDATAMNDEDDDAHADATQSTADDTTSVDA